MKLTLVQAHWEAEEAVGLMNSSQWPRLGYTKCVDGYAEALPDSPLHNFRCKNVILSHDDFNGPFLRDGLIDDLLI